MSVAATNCKQSSDLSHHSSQSRWSNYNNACAQGASETTLAGLDHELKTKYNLTSGTLKQGVLLTSISSPADPWDQRNLTQFFGLGTQPDTISTLLKHNDFRLKNMIVVTINPTLHLGTVFYSSFAQSPGITSPSFTLGVYPFDMNLRSENKMYIFLSLFWILCYIHLIIAEWRDLQDSHEFLKDFRYDFQRNIFLQRSEQDREKKLKDGISWWYAFKRHYYATYFNMIDGCILFFMTFTANCIFFDLIQPHLYDEFATGVVDQKHVYKWLDTGIMMTNNMVWSNDDMYFPIFGNVELNLCFCITIVMFTARLLRDISWHPTGGSVTATLNHAATEFQDVLFVTMLLCFAFGMFCYVAFGMNGADYLYRNTAASFNNVARLAVGLIDYDTFINSDMGPRFDGLGLGTFWMTKYFIFWTIFLLLNIVVTNISIAIVCNAYDKHMKEVNVLQGKGTLLHILSKRFSFAIKSLCSQLLQSCSKRKKNDSNVMLSDIKDGDALKVREGIQQNNKYLFIKDDFGDRLWTTFINPITREVLPPYMIRHANTDLISEESFGDVGFSQKEFETLMKRLFKCQKCRECGVISPKAVARCSGAKRQCRDCYYDVSTIEEDALIQSTAKRFSRKFSITNSNRVSAQNLNEYIEHLWKTFYTPPVQTSAKAGNKAQDASSNADSNYGLADELQKLVNLYEQKHLTMEEFSTAKACVLEMDGGKNAFLSREANNLSTSKHSQSISASMTTIRE